MLKDGSEVRIRGLDQMPLLDRAVLVRVNEQGVRRARVEGLGSRVNQQGVRRARVEGLGSRV